MLSAHTQKRYENIMTYMHVMDVFPYGCSAEVRIAGRPYLKHYSLIAITVIIESVDCQCIVGPSWPYTCTMYMTSILAIYVN